ncbi:hypothetical protein KY316_00425, partial [Candidatus Woesearchaeota archaeon]|nr:hypothetical protein [Candidatus Woesearchaeota archaeon]
MEEGQNAGVEAAVEASESPVVPAPVVEVQVRADKKSLNELIEESESKEKQRKDLDKRTKEHGVSEDATDEVGTRDVLKDSSEEYQSSIYETLKKYRTGPVDRVLLWVKLKTGYLDAAKEAERTDSKLKRDLAYWDRRSKKLYRQKSSIVDRIDELKYERDGLFELKKNLIDEKNELGMEIEALRSTYDEMKSNETPKSELLKAKKKMRAEARKNERLRYKRENEITNTNYKIQNIKSGIEGLEKALEDVDFDHKRSKKQANILKKVLAQRPYAAPRVKETKEQITGEIRSGKDVQEYDGMVGELNAAGKRYRVQALEAFEGMY